MVVSSNSTSSKQLTKVFWSHHWCCGIWCNNSKVKGTWLFYQILHHQNTFTTVFWSHHWHCLIWCCNPKVKGHGRFLKFHIVKTTNQSIWVTSLKLWNLMVQTKSKGTSTMSFIFRPMHKTPQHQQFNLNTLSKHFWWCGIWSIGNIPLFNARN